MCMKNVKGIWFYGVSGSGKSYISNLLKNKIKNSVIVDGDIVRKYISYDLGYSLEDRQKQIRRMFGIGKIICMSKKFPIISTVYFDKKVRKMANNQNFYILHVIRKNKDLIKKNNPTYKNLKNIVGQDISYENFQTDELINDDSKNFWKKNKVLNRFI